MTRHVVAAAQTLGEALAALFPDASGRTRKQMLEQDRVQVNARPARLARTRLAPGDVVEVGATRDVVVPLPAGLSLVHEDEDCLVVDKGTGLLTIATAKERERTAYAYLSTHVKRRDPRAKVFIVHRLDQAASGLLVFARSPQAKRSLQEQFRAHTVERLYAALVEGLPARAEGSIEGALLESAGRVHVVERRSPGRQARTDYRLIAADGRLSLLEVRLVTGRKHQIRAHLASIGHPIAGDGVYGARLPAARLGLHARTLAFDHPRTGQRLRFESPVPGSWRRLRKRG